MTRSHGRACAILSRHYSAGLVLRDAVTQKLLERMRFELRAEVVLVGSEFSILGGLVCTVFCECVELGLRGFVQTVQPLRLYICRCTYSRGIPVECGRVPHPRAFCEGGPSPLAGASPVSRSLRRGGWRLTTMRHNASKSNQPNRLPAFRIFMY